MTCKSSFILENIGNAISWSADAVRKDGRIDASSNAFAKKILMNNEINAVLDSKRNIRTKLVRIFQNSDNEIFEQKQFEYDLPP